MRFGRVLIVRNKPSLSTSEAANLPATYLNITILGLHQACSAGPGRSSSNPLVRKLFLKATAQTRSSKRAEKTSRLSRHSLCISTRRPLEIWRERIVDYAAQS